MEWRGKVDNRLKFVQQQIFPPVCLLCGAAGHDRLDICSACLAGLPWNHQACTNCGLPLSGVAELVCGQCQRQPPHYQRTLVPFLYHSPLDWLIQGFKFHHRLVAGRLLAELLLRHVRTSRQEIPDLILPVPLHWRRLHGRGYNQALELARPLARELDVPLAGRQVRRQRATAVQSLLDATARKKNLRGAFAIQHPFAFGHVVIVDDVITTGSTVNELAKALRTAGVQRVDVWALARAAKQG